MTSPRDVRRELDALDDTEVNDEGEGDDGPPEMLTSPLTDPDDPTDVAPWYWTPDDGGTVYTPEEVDPEEHFICEMEMAIIRSAEWYDPDQFPDDRDEDPDDE